MTRREYKKKSFLFLFPVLGNVKRPLEFQVLLLVIVDEGGDSVVVTAGQHAGGSFLFLDYRGGLWLAFGD